MKAAYGVLTGILLFASHDARGEEAPLAPLTGAWIEQMPLGDEPKAQFYVTPPLGATGPRPIVVAVHGAMDDPGLVCSAWRLIVDAYAFVVCPPGNFVRKNTFVWSSSAQIEREASLAIAAVEKRYSAYVARGPVLYTGFSQGANMAGPVLARPGTRFTRAVLTEGGYHAFDALAEAFASAGGERILFTCSQGGCASSFTASKMALGAAKVQARVVVPGEYGHAIPPPVREALNREIPWVTEGMPGWEGYAAAPKFAAH